MIKHLPGFSLLLLVSGMAPAMQSLDDSALSAVSGRDGLSIQLEGDLSAAAIQATMDSTTISANNVTLRGVGTDGVLNGLAPGFAATIDAGSSGGAGLLGLGLDTIGRTRLRVDSLTLPGTQSNAANSFGVWAFDLDASVRLVNQGIFSMSNNQAYLFGEVTDADLFYRQGTDANAWMGMHDFLLRWEIPSGTLGVCADGSMANGCKGQAGIVHRAGTPRGQGEAQQIAPTASSIINLALDFEYIFGKKEGVNEFSITPNARGIMHFGWLGSVKDAEVKWMAGGSSQGAQAASVYGNYFDAYATTSEGMRFSSQWDYVSAAEAIALGDVQKEFRWRLGETADVAGADRSRINFELGDWTIWGTRTASKPSSHYFPLIAVDAIKGGQGPGGLCWGHSLNLISTVCGTASAPGTQFINTRPGYISTAYTGGVSNTTGDASALAIIVRDGQLQTYSRKVRLLERDAAGNEQVTREFDWGLIYSLANVDANIYLYPGGSASAGQITNGVIADIMLMSQTFDPADPTKQGFNWDHGTHLMIADTAANMGIGFMSSSFLLAGNDTRIWVRNQSSNYDSNGDGVVNSFDNDYYSGGIDFFSPEARFNYRATFGGGLLPGHPDYLAAGKPQTVRGALIDMNLEGLINLRFSPADPTEANNRDGARNFLGYSGALRLGSNASTACGAGQDCGLATNTGFGSYISLAEPGRPDVDVRFANITGDMAFTEGQVDLVMSGEGGSDRPRMKISNTLHMGYDAASRTNEALQGTSGLPVGGQPIIIDRVMLGQANLGSIVIPSARVYSAITLEPQTPNIP